MWIYTLWIYSSSTLENTDENKIFFVRSPQVFQQISAPGALSSLVTSVVLYALTRATLITPGKDETRVCGYIYVYIHIYIYIYIYIIYIVKIASLSHCIQHSIILSIIIIKKIILFLCFTLLFVWFYLFFREKNETQRMYNLFLY